jgi:hypothetical protein
MCNDHFDIQNSLFDILRFKIPSAKIYAKTYMVGTKCLQKKKTVLTQ